jgi:hypothetical protein
MKPLQRSLKNKKRREMVRIKMKIKFNKSLHLKRIIKINKKPKKVRQKRSKNFFFKSSNHTLNLI